MTQRALIWAAVSTKVQAADDLTSLPEQERAARQLADTNGWKVVDVLRVPGHSRRYIDIHDAARDMMAEGIDAFTKLMQHWQDGDFDVLIVRDGNRFARTQTLHAYVTERTIATNARIYSLADGWVDENNYRMWIAMNGYSAASDIDRLVKASQAPKDRLAERGLPPNGRPPWFLKVERTELGRALRAYINRDYDRLYADLASLILEGVGWLHIERELWQQFGHGRNGKQWPRYAMYHAVWHPFWWGHSARHYHSIDLPNKQRRDTWVFDDTAPLPPGVKIWRNTHDAVWAGELAESIKAELHRRHNVLRGQALHGRCHKFTGLLVCGHCDHLMVYHKDDFYRCRSKFNNRGTSAACERGRYISEKKVKAYVHALLLRMIELGSPDIFEQPDADAPVQRVQAIQQDIASIEAQSRRLIAKQADAPDSLQHLYDEQLAGLGEQLKILRHNLLLAQQDWHQRQTHGQHEAFVELAAYQNLADFWTRGENYINQQLHRLLGRRRLVIMDSQVVGTQ